MTRIKGAVSKKKQYKIIAGRIRSVRQNNTVKESRSFNLVGHGILHIRILDTGNGAPGKYEPGLIRAD
mgnify:CR=1 FL=1